MRKLTLFIIVLFSFIFSDAQTSFTLLGGIHNASVSPNYLSYPDTAKRTMKPKIGVELGLLINFEIKNGFSIRTGVTFSAKGSNWTQFYDTTNLIGRTTNVSSSQKNVLFSANTILTNNYIDAPLDLLYNVPLNRKTKFIVGAGPMFSLILSCHTDFNTLSYSQETNFEPKAHSDKKFIDLPVGRLPGAARIFHLGYNAFAGLDFGKVSLIVNYNKDINEFFEDKGRNYKNKTFGITLGINIDGNDAKDID